MSSKATVGSTAALAADVKQGLTPELRQRWAALVEEHAHTNVLFASPEWLDHLASTSSARARVVFMRDGNGSVDGVVAVLFRDQSLQFAVGTRTLVRRTIRVADILGSLPLVPDTPETYHRVVQEILKTAPECAAVYVDALPVDSPFWHFLADHPVSGSPYFVHVVDGPRPWHLLALASTLR